jgi:hypothetical protein
MRGWRTTMVRELKMIQIYSHDPDESDGRERDGIVVFPSYARANLRYSDDSDYAKLLKKLFTISEFCKLGPVWKRGRYGGGLLVISNFVRSDLKLFSKALNKANFVTEINQMRGTGEYGSEAGGRLCKRVWKLGTGIDSFCKQTDKPAVRFASVRVSVEHDDSYRDGVYSVLLSSQLKSISQTVRDEIVLGLDEFGHNISGSTVPTPDALGNWRKYIEGRSEYSISWKASETLNAAHILGECWYVGEHLDLTFQPLQDLAVIGKFSRDFNFRPYWPRWQ